MTERKTREALFVPPDDLHEDRLAEPIALTPEQSAEANEREAQSRREWAEINEALRDNATAVTRAMARFHPGEREHRTEDALRRYEVGSLLIDRLGAEGVIDQDLAVVLLHLRRGLIDEYGRGPAAMMLIDRAVAAYQDFVRITGWIGNTALMVEHELFGIDRPSANVRDRSGREVREIRGLSVEEHIKRLSQSLIPLAAHCGRIMREALAALEGLRAAPSEAVERSRPAAVVLGQVASSTMS